MRKIFFTLSLMPLFFACNTGNQKENELLRKENELLKRELAIEKKENQITKETIEDNEVQHSYLSKLDLDIIELSKLMNVDFTSLILDSDGNIKYDSGTGSNGRFSGNMKNVNLSIEHKSIIVENQGLGNPSEGIIAVIHFRCKNGTKCLTDLGFEHSSSIMSFGNKANANKAYKLLNRIQQNL